MNRIIIFRERNLYYYNLGFIVDICYLFIYKSREKTITLNQSEMIPIIYQKGRGR